MSGDIVLVALSTFAERDRAPLEMLERSGRPFKLHGSGKRITPSELVSDGIDASVIVAGVETYDAKMLEALPALRCISRCGVGTDSIDLAAARSRGITVLNTPDVPTQAVAELALSLFLALSRNLVPQARLMQSRKWTRVEAHLLAGRTVGIVGLGRIGSRVAELCRAFGSRVVAADPMASPSAAAELGVSLVDLDTLLRSADIVSLHAGRTADQPLMIGSRELGLMRPGVILVNLARGSMVDEAALADALSRGHVAGAGLDVFSAEPYAGPLCDFEQVILTPHSATMPVETRTAMELECVDKALRFLDGRIADHERVA